PCHAAVPSSVILLFRSLHPFWKQAAREITPVLTRLQSRDAREVHGRQVRCVVVCRDPRSSSPHLTLVATSWCIAVDASLLACFQWRKVANGVSGCNEPLQVLGGNRA